MTEADIVACQVKYQNMLGALNELNEKSTKLLQFIFRFEDNNIALGKSYTDLSKSKFTVDSPGLLTTILKSIILLAETTGKGYNESRKKLIEDGYHPVQEELNSAIKTISELAQKLQIDAMNNLKDYKKSIENHEKAIKAVDSMKNTKEKDANDPVLKFVVSVQEKNAEKLVEAQKQQENAQQKLDEDTEKANNGIEAYNQEIVTCQTLFDDTVFESVKLLNELNKQEFEDNFECEITNAHGILEDLQKVMNSTEYKTFEDYKKYAIQENPALSQSSWLWIEESKEKPNSESHLSLENTVKGFCDIWLLTENKIIEQIRTIKHTFRSILECEELYVKNGTTLVKSLQGTISKMADDTGKPMGELILSWADALKTATSERVEVHQKFSKYLVSIVMPKLQKIQKSMEESCKNPRAEIGKLLKEIQNSVEDVEKTIVELNELNIKSRELKQNISKLSQADNKQMEKYMTVQVTLSDQIYEKETLLDSRKTRLISIVDTKMKQIRTLIKASHETTVVKQMQVCDCISGFIAFIQTFWEQSKNINTKAINVLTGLDTDAKCKELMNLMGIKAPRKYTGNNKSSHDEQILTNTPPHNINIPEEIKSPPQLNISDLHPNSETPQNMPQPEKPIKSLLSPSKRISDCGDPIPEISKHDDENLLSSPKKGQPWITRKFGVSEPPIDSFACAVSWKILLQGRIYVTKTKICFHSFFNNNTIIGGETKILIPIEDVQNIEKRYNAWIFDNSIAIKTKTTEFFFTSFVYRDRAYDLLEKCLKDFRLANKSEEILKPISLNEGGNIEIQQNSSVKEFLDKLKEIENERYEKIKGLIMQKTGTVTCDESFNCPMQMFFNAVYVEGSKARNIADEISENKDLQVIKDPVHPKFFTSLKEAIGLYYNLPKSDQDEYLNAVRNMPLTNESRKKYVHMLKNGLPIPFFPDRCTIEEEGTYYYVSPVYLIYQSKSATSGVPYGDYFYSYFQAHVKQITEILPNNEIRYKVHTKNTLLNDFFKDTVFKNKIDTETCATSINLYKDQVNPWLHNYFVEEMIKFNKLLANLANAKGMSIALYIPKIIKGAMGATILGDIRRKTYQLATMNRILENQRKSYKSGFIVVIIFAILLIYIIRNLKQ